MTEPPASDATGQAGPPLAPLSYRDPVADRRPFRWGLAAGGTACGAAVVAVGGFFGFLVVLGASHVSYPPYHVAGQGRPVAVVFVAVAVLGIGSAAAVIVRRQWRRAFVLGLCLGVGLTALIEGTCFLHL